MWKRFNREKEKQIGNPVLIETTYDEKTLGRIPHVADIHGSGSSPSGVIGNIPPATKQPQVAAQQRASMAPTVTSVYSQPSPELDKDFQDQQMPATQYYHAEVSPPISPVEENAPRFPASSRSRDVSPVEAPTYNSKAASRANPRQGSHIPVARKAVSGYGSFTPDGNQPTVGSGNTRWDTYSGEPSITGKEGQVKPGSEFSLVNRSKANGSNRAAPGGDPNRKLTVAERAARFGGGKGLSIETKPRPEWKGASGRTALVQPVQDKPAKQPFSLTRKIQRTLSPVMSDDSGQSPPLSATARRSPPVAHTTNVSTIRDRADTDEENEIKPTVPLKAGLNSPRGSVASPTAFAHPQPSPITAVDRQKPPTDSVPSLATAQTGGPSSQITDRPTPPRKSVETTRSSRSGKDDPTAVSRFSWTTYATNSTYQQSPPPSPPPPMPSVIHSSTTGYNSSRRRPVPGAGSGISPGDRKSVLRSSSPTSTVLTTASTSSAKALPKPPPEVESVDLIGFLHAQLDDLQVRRNNVKKLIRDFTKVQTSNPMTTNYLARRDAAQKQKDFEDELAEIASQEHEVGLRLHRAYKRREKDDPDASTTLWIRRVTG